MTVSELASDCGFAIVYLADGDRKVNGAYAGDLLSWVMGRAGTDNAFVTIMTNINVVAVASLADLSCVIFAESVEVPAEVLEAAEHKGINLLKSDKPMFETCAKLFVSGVVCSL